MRGGQSIRLSYLGWVENRRSYIEREIEWQSKAKASCNTKLAAEARRHFAIRKTAKDG